MEYLIKKGDNLSTLAKRFNTTVAQLAKANGIKNVNLIYAGKTLTVPDAPAPANPQPEWRQAPMPEGQTASQGLLAPDPRMFDPQTDAIQNSYPDLMMAGIPGMVKSAMAAKGLLGAAPAMMKQNPARYMPAVMKQNPTRVFNDLTRQVVANEPKFTIGGTAAPEAVALEDLIAKLRMGVY